MGSVPDLKSDFLQLNAAIDQTLTSAQQLNSSSSMIGGIIGNLAGQMAGGTAGGVLGGIMGAAIANPGAFNSTLLGLSGIVGASAVIQTDVDLLAAQGSGSILDKILQGLSSMFGAYGQSQTSVPPGYSGLFLSYAPPASPPIGPQLGITDLDLPQGSVGSVNVNVNAATFGAPDPFGTGVADPIILNLQGGAVTTMSSVSSGAVFDSLDNGTPVNSGWTTSGEGFLVLPGASGTVTNSSEMFSFAGLAAYDANHDGVINASDPVFASLRVWVNAAGDGVFRASDLYTLPQLGITSISLHPQASGAYSNGNVIISTGTFTYANGTTGSLADAALYAGAAPGLVVTTDGNNLTIGSTAGPAIELVGAAGQTVAAGQNGVSAVYDLAGGNTITTTSANTLVLGAANDRINAGPSSVVVAANNDTVSLSGGASNLFLEGTGAVVTGSGNGTNVEIDGTGNTVVLGGSSNVTVTDFGGANTVTTGGGANVSVLGNGSGATVGAGSK